MDSDLKTSSSMIKQKTKSYQKRFRKYGVDPRAMCWITKKAQEDRFRELTSDINFENKSVLDVGCGFGEIIPELLKKTEKFSYLGVDIVPEFIQVAKKKYPGFQFALRDYYKNPYPKKFDIILTSGSLNSKLSDPIKYRKNAIKVLFNHAREIVAFNMAGGHPQTENKKSYKIYYADSLEILNFCFTLTRRIIFRHHYRKHDFTILLFK